jgi:formylglycine-generating enzyme required for sulfatase activity
MSTGSSTLCTHRGVIECAGLAVADIFFSYKREDRTRVERLVRELERADLTVWWDPTLVAGERFDQVIGREIDMAKCIVVAWSASSINAVWVKDEASVGRDRGILVPLTLDGSRPPLGFRQFQTPDLSEWSGDPNDQRIRQFVSGVVRIVRNAPAPDPASGGSGREQPGGDGPPVPPRGGPSRRQLLGFGVAATAVAGLAGVGVWLLRSDVLAPKLPPPTVERFELVTVDAHGARNPRQTQSINIFEVPVGGVSMDFSVVSGASFQIGSPDSEPARRPNEGPPRIIRVPTFAMGRTVVTQALWAAAVKAAPAQIAQRLPDNPSTFIGDNLPVETVSWYQATEFCDRVSALTGFRIRLPSEAEWEFACRGSTTTAFSFGPTITPDLANYCGTGEAVRGEDRGRKVTSSSYGNATYTSGSYADGPPGTFIGRPVEVRSYPPNRFGLFEMHGNVWEHCFDTGPADYRQIPGDGSPNVGPQENHVLRGGSWSHNPAICRSAYRDEMRADIPGWEGRVGFRVVCELGDQVPVG